MRRPGRLGGVAAGITAAALLALPTGCGGSEPTAAEQVPALDARLDAVDAAVAAHDVAAARRAVDRLERTAMAAVRSGDLDQARLDEITAASEALSRALGDAPGATTQSPTPAPSTHTPTPTPEDDPEEPEEDKPEKPEKPEPPGHEKHDKGPEPGKGHGH